MCVYVYVSRCAAPTCIAITSMEIAPKRVSFLGEEVGVELFGTDRIGFTVQR
jgi:hypothetical protein